MASRRIHTLLKQLPCSGDPPLITPNPSYDGPMTGIRVVDLTQMVSGPMGTQILGDQGADVIKIEGLTGAAERGSARALMTSPLFSVLNRNKKSVCLDLKSAEGVELLKAIVAKSDIMIQNFRPGTVERLGISYDEMKKVNDQLIFVSISGFGSAGPYSQKRVYDPIIQAVSGLASVQANEEGKPQMMRLIVPDKVTALTSAQAMTAAVAQRFRTGKGCHIQLSMLDAVVSFAWAEAFARETFKVDGPPAPRAYTRDMVYETLDGFITCGAVQDKEWRGMCNALGKPEWLTDPRFATAAARSMNRNERFEETGKVLSTMSSDEAMRRLNMEQVPNGPINHPREKVLDDPQLSVNKLIFHTEHPHAPFTLRQCRPAAQFDNAPFELQRHAPLLGQDTRSVLKEIVGLNDAELDKLQSEKIIAETKAKTIDPTKTRDSKLNDLLSG